MSTIGQQRSRAALLDARDNFVRNDVLLLVEHEGALLMADGSWQAQPADPGADLGPDVGIRIPRGAVEAIAQAIQDWQGHASHADTEARVLRESLEVERRRVDDVLRRTGA